MARPSYYESVPGGLPDIRARVEALQRRFNEESKVGAGGGLGVSRGGGMGARAALH